MIAVVIPTVNRAGKLRELVENIREATDNPHTIYLVMELDDRKSAEVAWHLNARGVFGVFGSCSAAVNAGYEASTEPFVAIANDDCVFHPGWDSKALEKFSDTVHIVGMNDGYGDTKSFTMSRRAYIEKHSGVFDKPNTIFHTYKSQGPDTEFAFYAMLRGVWADAPDAIVQHVNWRRGAADDANYQKARDVVDDDLAEYHERWPQWDPDRKMPPPIPTVPSSR